MKSIFNMTVAAAAILSLSGCAMTENMTDKQQTQTEAAATGAAVGAVLGVLVGDSKKGAVVGALVGSIIASRYAEHVANKKQEYADNEAYMKAVIAEADNMIALSAEKRTALSAQIANQQKQLAAMQADQDKTEVDNDTLEKQKQDYLAAVKLNDELIAAIQQEVDIQKDVLAKEKERIPVVLVSHSQDTIAKLEAEHKRLLALKTSLVAVPNERFY